MSNKVSIKDLWDGLKKVFGAQTTIYIILSLILIGTCYFCIFKPVFTPIDVWNNLIYLLLYVTIPIDLYGFVCTYKKFKKQNKQNLYNTLNNTFKNQQPKLIEAVDKIATRTMHETISAQQQLLSNDILRDTVKNAMLDAFKDNEKYRQEAHKKDWRINNECNKAIYNELEQAIRRTNSDHMLYGEFHNGTESNMGIPFCKFSIIMATPGIEKFTEDYNQENISKYSIIQRKLKPNHWVVLNINEVKECDKRLYSDMKYYNLYKIALFQISNPEEDDYPLGFVSAFISNENKDNKFDITELYNSAQDIQGIKLKTLKLKK